MPGRFVIFAASFIGIGSISGIALGNYAVTTQQSSANAVDIHDLSGQIGDTASSYGPSYPSEAAAADMGPDHVPVCRKGCGPTLTQRQDAAYFDEGASQLDRIYAAGEDHYEPAPVPVARDFSAPPVVTTTTPPRVTYSTTEVPCNDATTSCGPTTVAQSN